MALVWTMVVFIGFWGYLNKFATDSLKIIIFLEYSNIQTCNCRNTYPLGNRLWKKIMHKALRNRKGSADSILNPKSSWSDSMAIQKRECHDEQRHNNGDEMLYWKKAALDVMLREACVCRRDAPKCQNSPLAAYAWRQLTRPDWRSWNVAFWLAQAEHGRSKWPARVQTFGVSTSSNL